MHPHHDNDSSNDIDLYLYPALLQVFVVILIGYLAGTFELLNKSQVLGLNKFVSLFALPSLLFRSIAVLDFSVVDWSFLLSIFISKSLVFFLAILFTLLTLRPINVGLAAVFAIFVSQSNDFALGQPIVNALYSSTHPDYILYIYLIAPISLCILNPIAFLMLEANEKISQNNAANDAANDTTQYTEIVQQDTESADYEEHKDIEDEEEGETESTRPFFKRAKKMRKIVKDMARNIDTDSKSEISSNDEEKKRNVSTSSSESSSIHIRESPKPREKLSTKNLIKSTLLSTISNPIVFMSLIGVAANFVLKQKIPIYIDPILSTLANSFSAIALFYLGFTMVGKIRNLTFSSIVIIIILIFSKSLIFPLLTREIVFQLESSRGLPKNETEAISTFAFLYGTFPAAPSLFFYLTRYKSISYELVSSALVLGTLVSAPIMMISGKMISIQYMNMSAQSSFDEIQCKTAYGFSILNWFCCLWVLYILIASGRLLTKPHRYTFFLVITQMLNSLVNIIWSLLNFDEETMDKVQGMVYVALALFCAFSTRCWILSIMLNLLSITDVTPSNQSRMQTFLKKLLDNSYFLTFIGLALPLLVTALCLILDGMPEKQGMIFSIGKPQIIVSSILLLILTISLIYCLILFARTKFEQFNLISLVMKKNKRPRYFSLGSDIGQNLITDVESQQIENHQITRSVSNNIQQADNTDNYQNFNNSQSDVYSMEDISTKYQIMQHIALITIFAFSTLMCFFFQIWNLFGESKTSVWYELQLIDTTLLYGQGFFTFLTFGLDNDYILEPVLFKIKEILKLIEPFKLVPKEQVPAETMEMCRKFERKYKEKCIEAVEKSQRFHHKYYHGVIKAKDFINWLLKNNLVRNRKQGIELGRMLIEGRVMHHVSYKRHFYDGFHLYKFS